MRRNQYSVEQIIGILKQHENGRPAKELCRQYGFSDHTLKRSKAKYKGMPVEEGFAVGSSPCSGRWRGSGSARRVR
jgi:methylphosphotriester-DNA--protein-cysteine methyltransferase